MTFPDTLTITVIGAEIAVAVLLLYGMLLTRSRLDPSDMAARRAVSLGAGALVAWFILTIWLSHLGVYRAEVDGPLPPPIVYGIILPILTGIAFIRKSRALGRVLAAVPQHWLIGVQLYRILGIVFLVSHAQGLLPGVFAVPAGYGDILAGLSAALVAYLYARKSHAARRAAIVWNSFGIADLIVAVTLGFLSSPGQFHILSLDAPNQTVSNFPMVLVPVFAVPLSILLHVCSLTKLSREAR